MNYGSVGKAVYPQLGCAQQEHDPSLCVVVGDSVPYGCQVLRISYFKHRLPTGAERMDGIPLAWSEYDHVLPKEILTRFNLP